VGTVVIDQAIALPGRRWSCVLQVEKVDVRAVSYNVRLLVSCLEIESKGLGLERNDPDDTFGPLARAVRWHLEDQVLVDGKRTVVFE
jgi:hypothetical protein